MGTGKIFTQECGHGRSHLGLADLWVRWTVHPEPVWSGPITASHM